MTTVSKVNFPNVLTSAPFSTATQKEMAKNIGDNAMAGVMKTPVRLAADTVDLNSAKNVAKKSLTKGTKAGIAVAAAAVIGIGGFVANKIMKAKNNEQTKA